MNRDDVERLIADHGVETVKTGTPDMDGVYRGKRVSAKQFVEGCEGNGFAQCDVLFGWDIAEEVMTGLDLAIGSADTGFADILLRWAGPSSHALFEALSHASISVFGEAPFAARLPAALFGIAGVWAIHALAADILDRRHAWTIAGVRPVVALRHE